MARKHIIFAVTWKGGAVIEPNRCTTIEEINKLVIGNELRPLIRFEEAKHEKQFCRIAERICRKEAVAVMLSGPSSSGKTTAANRLATQLRVHGKKPVLISLDDYYIDRDRIAPGPDGKLDLEHINTIDTELFARNLQDALAGCQVEIPTFNFKTGRREWNGHILRLERESVIIVEGLHALNPDLLPKDTEAQKVFGIYICPQLPPGYGIADHELRLLRRIVRDYESRGTSVQRTIAMWDSVRQGEKRWIFPYRDKADAVFNSAALYEPAVLKKYIFPLLREVPRDDEAYSEVCAIRKLLELVHEANVEDEIPPTSLVREFICGNTFYRK